MSRIKGGMLCVMAMVLIVGTVGCFDMRPVSIGAKLLSNPTDPPIGDLDSSEWQWLSDNVEWISEQFGITLPEGTDAPSLTSDQAQVIVDFLDANSVVNASDLEDLAVKVEAGTVVIPDSLLELAEAMGVDVSELE